MNERIQVMAGEAEDYADSIVDSGGEFHPAYTQKLAELILNDVLNIVAVGGEFASRPKLFEKIKEHFGVEE